MEQFEQLLTCAICLDRYRNPKLLPCQHSFCMEPCMDGLVDYVRRQVKCPECRAEHRIPYQGVQGYPTNVTLQRFLELHIEITGELPDPTSGQVMERCNVCSEKSYCSLCVHCEKKICGECKEAHMEILRREISRINNQIRRALHRLQDALAAVDRNAIGLQGNCAAVAEEVDEVHRRLTKAVKDRTDFLRAELERYLTTEQRNLATLRDHLELEVANIQSNCDLADKHMGDDGVDWDDAELVDAKEIFLRTVEFIRNFDYEPGDYARRVRFVMAMDPNQLVLQVGSYGELSIHMPTPFSGVSGTTQGGTAPSGLLQAPAPSGPGLMRSKSDHRLAFRQEERWKDEEDEKPSGRRLSPLAGRKFGERYGANRDRYETPRYGRSGGGGGSGGGCGGDYGDMEYGDEGGGGGRRSRFRSRFARHQDNNDSDGEHAGSGRAVRFSEAERRERERERVFDTEDATKGPLSGITRLSDSPRVMKRLQESELKEKRKGREPPPQPKAPAPTPFGQAKKAQRQMSEEDEISRIKKQNKAAPGEAPKAAPGVRRSVPEEPAPVETPPPAAAPGRRSPASEVASSSEESDEETVPSMQNRKPEGPKTTSATSRRSSASSDHAAPTPAADATRTQPPRAGSSDSSASESSASSTAAKSSTPATDEASKRKGSVGSGSASRAAETRTRGPEKKETGGRFQSRFLPRASTPAATVEPTPTPATTKEESESSSESEESDSDEESEEESKTTKAKEEETAAMEKSDIGPLLARSANARESPNAATTTSSSSAYGKPKTGTNSTTSSSPYASRYGNRDDSSTTSKYLSGRTREEETPASRYGSSGYTSRFLNKSKSSAALSPEEDEGGRYEDKYPSGRSRLAAIKDRRSRLARSKSSHNFGADEDEDDGRTTASSTSAVTPSSYLSRYGSGAGSGGGSDLSRSRSTHALKSRENSPERSVSGAATSSGGGEKDGAALSSWARYLKNKYGSRAKDKDASLGASSGTAASSAARRLSLGLPLRNSSIESSDDDQKNTPTSPTSPTAAGFGNIPRNQYLQKRRQLFKIGSRGSEPGCFTWPRGIAVGPDNSIVVADSSNHRVQVFDANGIFVKEFGGYGSAEGEFDCLAGVAVNRIGQFIIADRYNHRIQVLDPSGRFLRAFGSQGAADGRFNYPWGVTTDALGFIYVCDKENHRVQVFQSDGTFVGKFGSMGNRPGQLEHPHYVAVSSTNRVIVSDSNNHRVQIFDVNGRVLTTFGSEGSEEGQFKFPRGVAVDDQGYIFVGDSGNNRIQIFHPDGAFLRAFGCWGSGDGEFKGLEGVAVMANGNILVCDRENHRVQVF
ncbi:RING finger protein nhl-1 isoform X2 [Ischnura elegans]|uniref:RING finger protein nhl-1 isoform X2 n=1 Tax=Ischnura elegans TaxID=197161 RepID=UPI001ED895A1|nr:RING finger protein nhl-1 isoform X2 [Ischnura elegans]